MSSKLLAKYVHRLAALEAENRRLHAALKVHLDLVDLYGAGWREAYDARLHAETDLEEEAKLRKRVTALEAERAQWVNALDNAVSRDQWQAEALGLRQQIIDLSRELTAEREEVDRLKSALEFLHQPTQAGREEACRDAG